MTGGNLLYYALGWLLLFAKIFIDFVAKGVSWEYYIPLCVGLYFFSAKLMLDWSEMRRKEK